MRTILVIEDDLNLLEGLEIFLSMEGFRTYSSSNGREGLRLAQRHRPDLVLTNYQMPGADGLEVIHGIRTNEATRDTPIIFITANSAPSIRNRAVRGGANGYLMKPFTTDDLKEKIDEVLYGQVDLT